MKRSTACRLARPSPRTLGAMWLAAGVGVAMGLIAYLWQTAQNRTDALNRFDALSRRVTQGVVERMHHYEYGLRGARGVVVAAEADVTRQAFARYARSREFDREFPGARGFGIVFRVEPEDEAAFVRQQRLTMPGFAVRQLQPHGGERFVITYVEPMDRNREAVGLDIASEPARRQAALQAAESSQATLTAPITLVQASGKRSGGMLLLLPIRRPASAAAGAADELVGWSYAPLLTEEILRSLDAEEDHFALWLYDVQHDAGHAFYATNERAALAAGLPGQRTAIPLYGRRWEALLRPTDSFVASLNQPSPLAEGFKALLLGSVFSALLATLVQLVDRTRGQRLEQARRAAIVEGSSDAIVVQTLDGTITDWNDGATRLFGFTREQALGRTVAGLLLPPGLAREDDALRATVAGGSHVRVFETERRAQDGTSIPVSITASPIRNSKGVVVGSAKILHDMREAKAAEQRMRELNASLEDQVRERTALLDGAMREAREANAAKSRFLANISHEIRTPMNAVIGLSHLLSRTRLDADQAQMLARIRTAGKALMSLLNDVLDLSKIEAGEMALEMAPFQLDGLIDDVASLAGVSAQQRGIGFSVSTTGDMGRPLLGDRTRLSQILLNLLSNAVKFTEHGLVTLHVQLGEATDAGRLPVSFTVSDTGVGIAAEQQARLFQPFVQADASTTRRFGGTGLGLSIVRQLVELLGGRITLRSAAGQGSVFQVDLQLAPAPQGARRADAPVEGVARTGLQGLRLLVVDDNEVNRAVADCLLRSEGAEVVLATNGEEALAHLAHPAESAQSADSAVQAPGIDAVLMDVQMPVMDGLQATRLARALPRHAHLPIIGLTAGVSSDERRQALDAGMDDVVGKPFDPQALADVISRHVRDARPAPRE